MKYFKLVLACMGIALGIAEVHAQTAYKEIRPGVNAQQFISAASGENSLQTGQLSVNIPLFDLQSKGINVPISIAFSGGDITHESEASHIGLGWSLLAGGVITQTIRDANDQQTSSPDNIPWQYEADYLQSKLAEEHANPYNTNKFEMAMDAVIGFDGEPDIYHYSFLGYAGDICFKFDGNDGSGRLYPDQSFKIEATVAGYKIIANDGVVYFFEMKEKTADNATSWFLTEIRTLLGGSVTFQYTDDYSYDLTYELGASLYAPRHSKRLTRIDYEYGYVILTSAQREDMYYNGGSSDSRKITNIELYNGDGLLIKGYEFRNSSYILNEIQTGYTNWKDKRLKLESVRAYNRNGEYLPPFEFEYDYHFELSKNSSMSDPFPDSPKNTWAANPVPVAIADRLLSSELYLWTEPVPDSEIGEYVEKGVTFGDMRIDGHTIKDYFCITKIKFPSGGSESYYYEKHDYGFVAASTDTIKPPYSSYIKGRRLWKKEIDDGNGNRQIVEYEYCLHDEDYYQIDDDYFMGPRLISSGVLVNPTIHTTAMYKPIFDGVRDRLVASPYYTREPQNNLSGSPVCYVEVEEIFKSQSGSINGKKIHYFERNPATPAQNYVYLNYNSSGSSNILTVLPSTLYGKQQFPPEFPVYSDQNYSFLAYPLGKFDQYDLMNGKLVKEVTLDASGKIVKKIENEYTPGYGVGATTLYGLLVQKFDDTADYTGFPEPGLTPNRYLISQTVTRFDTKELVKTVTTNYYPNSSITQEQTFAYTSLNLLKSSSVTQSTGETILTENVYPSEIDFQTEFNLAEEASSIQKMKDVNMIGIAIQTTARKGTEYLGGNYTTYKQLPNGAIVIDSIFSLGTHPGAAVSEPFINTNGEVQRNINFTQERVYLSYDENANPTTVVLVNGIEETLVWGYGGQYPIAKIENYTEDQLDSNIDLVSQLGLLDDYTVINESDRANLFNCNETIRNSLPDYVMVTTYTYDPLNGITSETDPNGLSTFYEYDSFGRLKTIRDDDWQIVKTFKYHYAVSD